MIPYTYLIGWTKQNIWYYGARYSKTCSPDDLWNTYFTSSKRVKELRKEIGEPDVVKVRRIFKTREQTWRCEVKVLTHIKNTKTLNNWLNRSIGGQRFGPHSEETKRKISEFHKTRIHTAEENEKISKTKRGKLKTADEKRKISETLKGRVFTEEHLENLRISRRKRVHSEQTKINMSISAKKKPFLTCPHCGKSGKGGIMKRWHFDNCKFK